MNIFVCEIQENFQPYFQSMTWGAWKRRPIKSGPRDAEKEEKVRKMTNDLVFRLQPNSMEKYSKSKTLVRADSILGHQNDIREVGY